MKPKKIWENSSVPSKEVHVAEKFPPLVFKPVEPESEIAYNTARTMVSASAIKRRSEQSTNIYSLLTLAMGIVVVFGYFYLLQRRSEIQANEVIARQTQRYEDTHGTPISNWNMYSIYPTTSPHPFMTSTPTITPTVAPSPTSVIYSVNVIFKYSYYNPKLGGWNCFTWDSVLNDCVSLMANGEDWHNNYGKVVACAPEIALGTVMKITYPDALKGFWVCKDRGSLITGQWIDFLDITQRYTWGEPVSATLYPPTIALEQVTQGTH